MERVAVSLFPSIIWLRMCFTIYVVFAVVSMTSSLVEINKHNGGKAAYTKEGSDLVKNFKKSTISLHQHGNNKVDGNRNHSAMIGDERNSAALNRFLEDVLRARNDLKWIDHAARRINHRTNLADSYKDEHSAGSVNVEEVLGRADIGYGSRLRGKRGFDRNYETMWMLQEKKKYGAEGIRDVPQRVYRDNDMTFKRDADGVDFDAPDRSRDTLDRAFYERGAMADQPLKDWARKKDLHSSAGWPNSNENPEISNAESTWFRDYEPIRGILVDSDSRKNEDKLHVDVDTRNSSEIVSLYDPTHVDDFAALRESSAAVKNAKSEYTPVSLESLKRIVLKLKNSLTLRNRKESIISPRGSNWWDEPRSAIEVFDLVRRDFDEHPEDEETIWRIKRAKRANNENDSGLGNSPGSGFSSYLEERNLKESHDRGKRNRRSFFVDSGNQTSTAENETPQKVGVIKDQHGNATKTQTNSLKDIALSETSRTSRQEISRRPEAETTAKTVDCVAMNRVNSSERRNPSVSNASANSILCFSTCGSVDDSRESSGGHANDTGMELGVAVRKVSRCSADDERSKGVVEEFPRGNNTSRGFGSATNESCGYVVETVAAVKAAVTNGTREENREPIPVVIRISEQAEGRSGEERETARLSRQTEGQSAEKMRTSGVDESKNANAKKGSSSSPTDLVVDTGMTTKPDSNTFGNNGSITPSDRHNDDLAPIILDNDLRKQQMVPSVRGAANANRSDGNSKADEIDIRAAESNENETMNVKKNIRAVMKPREYREFGNNLRRRLLWISASSSAEDEARKRNEMITAGSSIHPNEEMKRREGNAEEGNPVLQTNLDSRVSDANRYARYKRSAYSPEDLEPDDEADPDSVAIEREAPINPDEKQQEDNEEYENQSVEGNYNDREEAVEEKDETMETEREGRSSPDRAVDPVKAKINMLIKQRLEKQLDMKNKEDRSNDYSRKKRNTLGTIEYYDYDGDEEQETRDALENQPGIKDADIKLSAEDNAKVKRDDETQLPCKSCDLGIKKNENAEAMMKEERRKARLKNKVPKEEFIVDVSKSKKKTEQSDRNDRKPTDFSGSRFEDAFKEEQHSSAEETPERIRQSEDVESDTYEEPTDTKSERLDVLPENKILSSKNSEPALEDAYKKPMIFTDKPLKYMSKERVDVDPDIIEDILLDVQPIKILEQNRELETKDFYDNFNNERPEDRYYYQENDWRHRNDVEPLYEELKKVYDWPDGELKSGPRLRGDQRLRYESDDKLDKISSQLQPSDNRFLVANKNDDAQTRFHSVGASWTTAGSNSTPSSYLAFKITSDTLRADLEQHSSPAKENSPNISSVTIESRILEIAAGKNSSRPEGIVRKEPEERPMIESGSPYENRKYIESEKRKVLKQNLNSQRREAISSQDLRESFVEPMEWRDDLDDTVKVRLGRGLKAVDETPIPNSNKIHDNKINATDVNAELGDSQLTLRNNTSRNWYGNTTTKLIDTPNIRHGTVDQGTKRVQESIPTNLININSDEDLEVAEQKYTDHATPRIRRAAASYRAFYDEVSPNQRDSDEADGSVNNRIQPSNILEDRADSAYRGYTALDWNNDVRDLDRYSKMSRSTNPRKRQKAGMRSKKKKKKKKEKEKYSMKISEKHAKEGSHSSSSSQRSRRHHMRQSDTSRNNRDNRKLKKKKKKKKKGKEKDEGSHSVGRGSSQKSKLADRELIRAGMNEASGERVLYENAEDQSTVKPEVDDARRKEITLLLAADDVDDESQMDVALHGELAGKIVEQIFEQVQKNDQLKNAFGPGLYRDYKTEDVIKTTGNVYRQGVDEDGTNHTEATMKRIMELLGRLILNEVQKKTCVSLSPDMREFLGWMLGVEREEESLEQAPPLPFVHEEIVPEENTGRKFLFDSTSRQEGEEDISDLQKKVRVLETLVQEYNALTAKEKTKVQTVYDYLVRQLNLLLRYIEAREAVEIKAKPTSISTGAARARTGNILQYQSAMPNATIANASYWMTKDAFRMPIDTHNLFRFDNDTYGTTDKQFHDGHVASRRRETRSLDEVPSKQRERKRRKRKRRKNANHAKPNRRRKHREHRTRQTKGSLSDYRRSRRKRADPEEENHHGSLYLGYEEPTIYDSLDVLDAKLTGKRMERKRELADKKNVETVDGGTVDLLPIKGKNRLEDEVILLNKREAWRRENEEQLEEVAFGKDMRNGTRRERERFEKLTRADKRKPIDETSSRTKREDIVSGSSTSANCSNHSHAASAVDDNKSRKNPETITVDNDNATGEDKLRLIERKINVFADNETAAAIDIANTKATPVEKAAINAGIDNRVKGKLGAINCKTKIDNADTGTRRFINLTSDMKSRVSQERRKVSEAERETADDNAVKLNRATNYRGEKIDPEIELKNLKRTRERTIYGAADSENAIYNDDNLSASKLREKYMTKSDELGDLDTDAENNSELLRLRGKKWPGDVVEWRMIPIIKRSSYYYDDRALSRFGFSKKEAPVLSGIKNVVFDSDVYNDPTFWRLTRRGRRNGVFNIAPLRIFDDRFPRRIYPRAKHVSQAARFKDLRIDPEILLEDRKFSRSRRSNGRPYDVAKYRRYPLLKETNRQLRNVLRSRDNLDLDDRTNWSATADSSVPALRRFRGLLLRPG